VRCEAAAPQALAGQNGRGGGRTNLAASVDTSPLDALCGDWIPPDLPYVMMAGNCRAASPGAVDRDTEGNWLFQTGLRALASLNHLRGGVSIPSESLGGDAVAPSPVMGLMHCMTINRISVRPGGASAES